MPITSKGKDAVMKEVFNGAQLALGTMSEDGSTFTEINTSNDVNPGYNRMPISFETATNNNTILYVSSDKGVMTNSQDAYFHDADDGKTPDSLESHSTGGWTDTIDSIGVYKGSTLYYASKFSETPISVYQGHRIKIAKGKFTITFSPIETSNDGINAVSELNLDSDVDVEVEKSNEGG